MLSRFRRNTRPRTGRERALFCKSRTKVSAGFFSVNEKMELPMARRYVSLFFFSLSRRDVGVRACRWRGLYGFRARSVDTSPPTNNVSANVYVCRSLPRSQPSISRPLFINVLCLSPFLPLSGTLHHLSSCSRSHGHERARYYLAQRMSVL